MSKRKIDFEVVIPEKAVVDVKTTSSKAVEVYLPGKPGNHRRVTMLYVENVVINNREFTHTWSDRFIIKRDGVVYSDAIDPIDSGRVYTETDIPLDVVEE